MWRQFAPSFLQERMHLCMLSLLRTLPWLLCGSLACLRGPSGVETAAVLLAVGLSGPPSELVPLCHRLRFEPRHAHVLWAIGIQGSAALVPLCVLGARLLPGPVLARALLRLASVLGAAGHAVIKRLQGRPDRLVAKRSGSAREGGLDGPQMHNGEDRDTQRGRPSATAQRTFERRMPLERARPFSAPVRMCRSGTLACPRVVPLAAPRLHMVR